MHQSTDKKKIVIYIIFLFILSTTTVKYSKQQENSFLRINKIHVVGLSNSKNLEIQRDLNNIFYRNILLLSKKEINKIINKHNIIEEYNIRKISLIRIFVL